MSATLISKNITINGRRTSLRLEKVSWEALRDICANEGLTVHELCGLIESRRHAASRTSAVRAFIVKYLHLAARESGALARPDGSGGRTTYLKRATRG